MSWTFIAAEKGKIPIRVHEAISDSVTAFDLFDSILPFTLTSAFWIMNLACPPVSTTREAQPLASVRT